MTTHPRTDPTRTMVAADRIRELIHPYTTSDRITRYGPIPNLTSGPTHWARYSTIATTHHPPLLDQLEAAVHQSRTGDYAGGLGRSKPPARLDAIDTLTRIDTQSAAYATELGIPQKPMRRRLSAISGKVGANPDRKVTSWWVAAKCLTGWEQPPFEPDVPCPNTDCEARGTLRVRLDTHLATCTRCGATWDETNYAQLGAYIRWAFEHLTGPRHWRIDRDGYPVECADCLTTRRDMANRQAARIHAAKAADTPNTTV